MEQNTSSDKQAVDAAMRACLPNGITDEEFLMLSALRQGSEMSYKDASIRILAAEVERLRGELAKERYCECPTTTGQGRLWCCNQCGFPMPDETWGFSVPDWVLERSGDE